MDKAFLDIVFVLNTIKNADDTIFQRECCIEFIGRHYAIYQNEQIRNTLMTVMEDKFKLNTHEA